jgi:hypothetical protein
MTESMEFGHSSPGDTLVRRHGRAVAPSTAAGATRTGSRASSSTVRLWSVAWAPLVVGSAVAACATWNGPPWLLMWVLSSSLWLGLKWATIVDAWRAGLRPGLGHALGYMFAWPNTDALTFLGRREKPPKPTPREWAGALLTTFLGLTLLYVGVRLAYPLLPLAAGWIGMIGLVLVLHFGLFQLLALAWRGAGITATSLMQSPIRSTSLAEFWGRRWNTGFSGPARRYLHRPLSGRIGPGAATLSVFVVSGLLHETVISVPAGGGYGLPAAYFLFQALMVPIERSRIGRRLGLGRGFRGWVFVLLVTAGPAFVLFHSTFVREVILPFLAVIGGLERSAL